MTSCEASLSISVLSVVSVVKKILGVAASTSQNSLLSFCAFRVGFRGKKITLLTKLATRLATTFSNVENYALRLLSSSVFVYARRPPTTWRRQALMSQLRALE